MFAETTSEPAIQEQLRNITLGAQDVFPAADLAKKVASGRPLRIKLGFDPTKPDLHLGHAVVLGGLRRFQDAGHQIVVIIGDFTARIGDPTGKESARPPMSTEEIEQNARTYLDQLGIVVDISRAEIRHNSEWLAKLSLAETISLLGKATVAQMLSRENFARRYERGDAIGLHEFLYPLMQGYDSVQIGADVELGGTDQRFNLLVGRDLQAAFGQDPQVCVTYPILEGIDGKEKMSKSLDNYIGLTMPPAEMYGRTMSIPDALLASWFPLTTGLSAGDIAAILAGHPRDAKMRLAREIAARYHGAEAARSAEEQFVRQFQQRELPADIPEVRAPSPSNICALLVRIGLAKSTSYVRQLLSEGAIKRHDLAPDGQVGGARVLLDPKEDVEIPPAGFIIQVGKRRFAKVLPE
ncbi:MAG: tyrosine--tRNA ligase [Candidatus Sericytochromatia bacterium]|nr:tyrosine--tRNA ligase [Candidatus Tanganyikabacteria bacterium]